MKKSKLFLALILISIFCLQCTDDEVVEDHLKQTQIIKSDSGDEGDDDMDSEKN